MLWLGLCPNHCICGSLLRARRFSITPLVRSLGEPLNLASRGYPSEPSGNVAVGTPAHSEAVAASAQERGQGRKSISEENPMTKHCRPWSVTARKGLALAVVASVALLAWPDASWRGRASAQTVPSPVPTATSTPEPTATPEAPVPSVTVEAPGPAATQTVGATLVPQPSPTPSPGGPSRLLTACLAGLGLALLAALLLLLLLRRRRKQEPPAAPPAR